ncbi:MAG: hypothetical protein WAZ27_05280 [Minisyncoccia bacterium]
MKNHGTALSIGQFTEFSAAVIKALPRDIDPEVALNWANNGAGLAKVLKDALCPPETAPEKPKVLRLHKTLSVGSSQEPFDADAFFVNRPGLWVSEDFKRLILPKAKIVLPATTSIKSFDLMQNARDREIKAELPEKHEVALWHIAKLIEGQEGGKSGPLLNNGDWNIFYFAGLVVGVCWFAGYREWYAHAWHLDGNRRRAEYRVFSSN